MVLERTASKKQKRRWQCQCECGNTTNVPTTALKSGNTRSCGCLSREVAAERRRLFNEARMTHGMTKSPTWSSWRGMICRCTVPVTNGYRSYGGRGVQVHPGWVGPGGFARFLEDVGERPEGTTLGRIGDGGDYIPGNVKWMTHEEQLATRRAKREREKAATCVAT